MKITYPVFESAARSVRVECATCGCRPGLVTVEQSPLSDAYELTYRCHGATERRTVDVSKWQYQPIQWPRRLFLRNWASHGDAAPRLSTGARMQRRLCL